MAGGLSWAQDPSCHLCQCCSVWTLCCCFCWGGPFVCVCDLRQKKGVYKASQQDLFVGISPCPVPTAGPSNKVRDARHTCGMEL